MGEAEKLQLVTPEHHSSSRRCFSGPGSGDPPQGCRATGVSTAGRESFPARVAEPGTGMTGDLAFRMWCILFVAVITQKDISPATGHKKSIEWTRVAKSPNGGM